ncbi:MAG: pantothenate kinase [Microcoleaceae cyanobacterium]
MYLPQPNQIWLGLIIGNSRLHWAKFQENSLIKYWDTDYLNPSQHDIDPQIPIILASVVPQQTLLWQSLNNVKVITLENLSLNNLYPTLGIDRALSVLGIGVKYGWPAFVIDAGTALTFTGVDADQNLVGGAILPGLKLQFSALSQHTAALPNLEIPSEIPSRWALETPSAIESGITYTILAGIRDFIEAWLQDFPNSSIAITGGDRCILFNYLKAQFPDIVAKIILTPEAVFWGLLAVNQNHN